jgi:RimJ/RimL family protein N-acetyltransferase
MGAQENNGYVTPGSVARMSLADRIGRFPTIDTRRLRLREVDPPRDAEPKHSIWSDEQTMRFMPDALSPSVEDARNVCEWWRDRFYDDGYILAWTIAHRESDELVGGIRYIKWARS